jgi:chromosome segregation ATPase
MAEASNSGFERLNDALRNLDDQLQELRLRFDDQLTSFENKFQERRDEFRSQLSKTQLYKRTEQVRRDIGEQFDQRRSQLYETFGIATKSDIQKLNRKLNALSKRLNEIAEERSTSPHIPVGEVEADLEREPSALV